MLDNRDNTEVGLDFIREHLKQIPMVIDTNNFPFVIDPNEEGSSVRVGESSDVSKIFIRPRLLEFCVEVLHHGRFSSFELVKWCSCTHSYNYRRPRERIQMKEASDGR